jgi:hypothetical protein
MQMSGAISITCIITSRHLFKNCTEGGKCGYRLRIEEYQRQRYVLEGQREIFEWI